MRAGDLTDRIVIEHRGPTRSPSGQPVPGDWAPFVTLWADVRHLSGTAAIKAGAETSTVQASMRIRRRTDVDASMRVQFAGTVYKIKAALPGADRTFVDLVCEVTK
ncbi:phage head closure protein [Acidovorax sp.]|uniref:phage head closure protein n=1 Tax=Acidovorax sp. TaxID=1872122 RepID=UPI002ACD2533|nr:phage head closure protein [Acidovorax sp.]MDZ7863380.1 phage head closure protein [Acidovorax sp.]